MGTESRDMSRFNLAQIWVCNPYQVNIVYNEPDKVLRDICYNIDDDPTTATDYMMNPANLDMLVFTTLIELRVTIEEDDEQGIDEHDRSIEVSGTLGEILLDIHNFYTDKTTEQRFQFGGLLKLKRHTYKSVLGHDHITF